MNEGVPVCNVMYSSPNYRPDHPDFPGVMTIKGIYEARTESEVIILMVLESFDNSFILSVYDHNGDLKKMASNIEYRLVDPVFGGFVMYQMVSEFR